MLTFPCSYVKVILIRGYILGSSVQKVIISTSRSLSEFRSGCQEWNCCPDCAAPLTSNYLLTITLYFLFLCVWARVAVQGWEWWLARSAGWCGSAWRRVPTVGIIVGSLMDNGAGQNRQEEQGRRAHPSQPIIMYSPKSGSWTSASYLTLQSLMLYVVELVWHFSDYIACFFPTFFLLVFFLSFLFFFKLCYCSLLFSRLDFSGVSYAVLIRVECAVFSASIWAVRWNPSSRLIRGV